ncbi:thioesterase family protein [Desulfatiferula olefinivorans]
MHRFDQDMALEKKGETAVSGRISDEWSINGNPNGGYIMALMLSSMLDQTDKKHPAIVTANYIGPARVGEDACFDVEIISRGKSFDRMQSVLTQQGKEKVRAWATFAEKHDECGDTRYERTPPTVADRDSCIPIPEFGGYTLYRNMDVRLDPACAGWFQGQLADISEHKGWIRFKDPRPMDAIALVLMADAFPPPVMSSQGMQAWVPTIEFSVNIRSVPQSSWLRACFRSRYITCGLVEEDGELWDENGTLVAISRQIAQFRNRS